MSTAEKLKKFSKFELAANDAWKKFHVFNNVAFAEGAIPAKYKELIALGVAMTTQCTLCLDVHVESAKRAGATQEELAEVGIVAAAMRAGAAFTHGSMILDD